MNEYKLYIDDQWVASSKGLIEDDINPADGSVYARVHQATREDLERALAVAQARFATWKNSLPAEREKILCRAADILETRMQEFSEVLIDEGGAPFGKSMFEVGFVIGMLRSVAGECRRTFGETYPSDIPGMISFSIRQPLGVVAAIAPFNFPLILAMKKVAFAVAAGNTMVLKPSPHTPVICFKLADLLKQAGLPAGVINVLPADGELAGDVLTSDPRVKLVTFTGSTPVGRILAQKASPHFKKITLEMGGKNPLIVLADADLDYAVNTAAFGVYIHQGQICMAGTRVIVEQPVYEQFLKKLVAKVKTLKMGNPREHDTVIGPLIQARQCEIIAKQLADAKAKGARLLIGGGHKENFFEPTVLADITREMDCYDIENFGPVIGVMAAKDSDDALRIANDTAYGLSSAVMTNDLQKAMDIALKLEAGMVHVNSTTILDEAHVPFGGVKNSGFGREGGHYSMAEMTELKWITIQLGEQHYPF
ncbi:MAG: aldehyde dehydrogenase family protein [Gammaproteobacteria bacterium]|nr:MAG: aldehyde dehydrogenase family protein [Gammaproteobacteria bacterium]